MTDPSSFTFSLLTYNINDGMISESAPTGWTLDEQHDRLSDLICERRPDLLCLQECFTFPSKLMGDYDFHGEVPSHRGSCFIGTLKDAPLRVAGPALAVGPCILLPLCLCRAAEERRFLAASAHLAPFAEFGPVRARQIAAIVAAAPAGEPLVLAGDFNMREKENAVGTRHSLLDAWVEGGSPVSERWSWNTHVNRYYTEGHKYTARYDRVLYRGCRILNFELVGNQPCSRNKTHYLSDHFGLYVRLQLT
ncbi:hypothetical protein Vretimale_2436 [Volvox reticuliferus]|uniref:Uncharacterized protein n=1 Tax=Volvox reticuliferus TaxID=1737510 RepID=A0A8J4C3L0_9CHLO|nr:hypothetical protein Vretifemale_4736 [Volvox reticuliferus]GIL96679.1 hypothetical protein Vretimale_2436 [Volvox reticuliferus]